jgi:hypothetical protein
MFNSGIHGGGALRGVDAEEQADDGREQGRQHDGVRGARCFKS